MQGVSTAIAIIKMPTNIITQNQFSLAFSNIVTLCIGKITIYYPLMSIMIWTFSTTNMENSQYYGNENTTSWYGVSSNFTLVRSQAVISFFQIYMLGEGDIEFNVDCAKQ